MQSVDNSVFSFFECINLVPSTVFCNW